MKITEGMTTSELILTVVALIVAGALVIWDGLDAKDWVDYSKWLIGSYVVSRGLSKFGNQAPREGRTRR